MNPEHRQFWSCISGLSVVSGAMSSMDCLPLASDRLVIDSASLNRKEFDSMSNSWMNQKVSELPTVKPGKQFIEISKVETISDEKGNRALVTFKVSNDAEFSKMFFEQSIIAETIKDRDKDYNNMLAQLGIEDAKVSDVLKVGNRFYANIGYGQTAEGYTRVYPNIQSYIPSSTTEDDIEL